MFYSYYTGLLYWKVWDREVCQKFGQSQFMHGKNSFAQIVGPYSFKIVSPVE